MQQLSFFRGMKIWPEVCICILLKILLNRKNKKNAATGQYSSAKRVNED
jgi:hypothetical protein